MRLTLRHLLAYMDGNLRQEDAESFGKRIEESKVATDLYHKIRDVMKRIRLAAPSVNERSSIFDCNSVAEYLDNAMPSERVVEFEQGCLKSDMHLAEVASSHQILTVVQVEPAEIDPESRQRMYQLPKIAQQADEERTAAAEAATLLSGDGSLAATAKGRPRPVVPEYLREPSRKPRLLFAAAGVFLASAAIGLLLMAFNQFDADKPLGRSLAWVQTKMGGHKPEAGKSTEKTTATNDSEKSGAASSTSAGTTTAPAPSGAAAGGSATTSGSSSVAGTSNSGLARSASDSKVAAGQPPALLPPDNAPPTVMAPRSSGDIGTAPTAPGKTASGRSAVNEPPTLDKTLGSEKKPGAATSGSPSAPMPPALPKSPEVASAAGARATPPGIKSNVPEPPAAEPPGESAPRVGRFMSDGQDVLLKLEGATQAWRRVLPEEFLPAGQSLIALPCYRPRVVLLNVAATLEMLSGTKMDLAAPNAQGIPGVNIDYGRVIIKPLAQAGASVRVSLGGHNGTLTLANVDSAAGFEMVRIHAPGTDPEKVLSPPRSTLYVAKGSVIWDEGGKQPARLSAPIVCPLDAPSDQNGDSRQARDIPDWVMNNTTSDRDQRAALDVSQALPADRPASLVLMELSDNRRMEIRWLAVRCLSHLGRFEPMVSALNDTTFRSEWPDYIDQLREAIARGPETAAAIRAALNTKFGNDAPELFRMLWGYTDKDLSNGADAQLVKYLDSEAIIFRVLAINALKEITGQNFFYRAEQPSGKRATAVLRWKQQLAAGKIRSKASIEKAGDKTVDRPGDTVADKSKGALPPDAPPTAPVPLPEDNLPGNVPDISVPGNGPAGSNSGSLPPPPKPANPAPEDVTPGNADTDTPPADSQPK